MLFILTESTYLGDERVGFYSSFTLQESQTRTKYAMERRIHFSTAYHRLEKHCQQRRPRPDSRPSRKLQPHQPRQSLRVRHNLRLISLLARLKFLSFRQNAAKASGGRGAAVQVNDRLQRQPSESSNSINSIRSRFENTLGLLHALLFLVSVLYSHHAQM